MFCDHEFGSNIPIFYFSYMLEARDKLKLQVFNLNGINEDEPQIIV